MSTPPAPLFIDTETFSSVPIANGVYAYAEKAEVMLVSFAVGDGAAGVWDRTTGEPMPKALANALYDRDVPIVAHNAQFDRTLLKTANIYPPLSRWRCTQARALAHSLPGSLDALGGVLGLPADAVKDKAGKQLIQLFCKPRPVNSALRRATRDTHPAEWARFVEYARQDIVALREIARRLPAWNDTPAERALWLLDQGVNDRGVAVDIDLAESALAAVATARAANDARTRELTDNAVKAATQRDALLAHVLAEYGVDLPDMQAATLERRIADPDLPEALRELLALRLQASTVSTAKYKALLRSVSRDGRLRGTLQFCGASRTGRWSGRVFQPQNLPRPTAEAGAIDAGIQALKADCADLIVPDVVQLASDALRGSIVAPPGRKLVVADLSNIEGRVLAWLAGEQWKLDAFRAFDAGRGADLYKLAYAASFRVEPGAVTKGQRQIGKVQELAFGYEGGVGAWVTFAAAYGIDLEALADSVFDTLPAAPLAEAQRALAYAKLRHQTFGLSDRAWLMCDVFKRLWRAAHPATVSLWQRLRDAFLVVCRIGGQQAVGRLTFCKTGNWLRIVLPSGRSLCYPSPRVEADDALSYMGTNQYTRKWQRLKTYGGKLAENVTQAVARDVMAAAMPAAEAADYAIVLTVHDELVTETPASADYSAAGLAALMAVVPPWAPGLPLAAAGFESARYKKD